MSRACAARGGGESGARRGRRGRAGRGQKRAERTQESARDGGGLKTASRRRERDRSSHWQGSPSAGLLLAVNDGPGVNPRFQQPMMSPSFLARNLALDSHTTSCPTPYPFTTPAESGIQASVSHPEKAFLLFKHQQSYTRDTAAPSHWPPAPLSRTDLRPVAPRPGQARSAAL